MKIIKLFRLNKKNGLAVNEFDISKYKNVKKLSIDDIANKIAIKNGISIDEIKKEYASELELKYEQNFNLFIEKKIVDTFAYSISDMLFSNNKPVSEFNPFNGWQENQRYNKKTKTFEVLLSYKNRIEYESIGIHHQAKIETWKNLPKFVKHWTTPEGKIEIELIEKSLENLGKIKFEIYDVNGKKIETLYAKYKRANEKYNSNKEIIHNTKNKNGVKIEHFTNYKKVGIRISLV